MVTMAMVSRGSMPQEDQLFKVLWELNDGTDRAAAIVGGSLVEEALRNALEHHLHRNKKLTDKLFRPSGALGSFATKIELGYLVGIYGDAGLNELNIVKDIRNAFAHRLDIEGFGTPTIRDKAINLKFGERYTWDTKGTFTPNTDPSRPVGEWPHWFSVAERDAALASPRDRFLLSVGALTYGLSVPSKVAMPRPHF